MPERVAIYPGSFDPPTLGHLDLIQRARRMFDHLIVGVAYNNKKSGLFSVAERVEMLCELTEGMDNVEVASFNGLTVDFAQERNAIALVRGLRAVSDFEYEMSMAIMNRKMKPDIDTVCLMPSEPYQFVSSLIVREIAQFGGDTSQFVPPEVEPRLHAKFGA